MDFFIGGSDLAFSVASLSVTLRYNSVLRIPTILNLNCGFRVGSMSLATWSGLSELTFIYSGYILYFETNYADAQISRNNLAVLDALLELYAAVIWGIKGGCC